ncbi:MAG TPA: VOC family protein [Thermomicrobiales bacterium]|nr:VOC family protein [Thermomicrobiales bacterium]
MPASHSTPTVSSVDSDFATFGAVHLDVTDLDRALGFWRDLIGLRVLSEAADLTVLGVPGRPLVALHPGATGPLPRNFSGLYHLAIHVPTMEDFARIQARAEAVGYPQYPTDHLTHYANYLDDADGNGLEMVFETPERVGSLVDGPEGFGFIDADGKPHSGREAIDLPWLRSFLPDGNLEPGMPDGAVIGHLHLRVADMAANHAFYRDQIGFTPNMFNERIGMYDLSAGGSFPHRLAGNIWESGGRPQRPEGTAGLRSFTLVLRSPEDLSATVSRVAIAGGAIEQQGDAAVVSDPSGNRLLLTLADPPA